MSQQTPAAAADPRPSPDALQAAFERAGLDLASQREVIAWLAEQLADERYAQLDRAGHDPNERIPLARVLIDLPIARSPSEGADGAGPVSKVLHALCADDPRLFRGSPLRARPGREELADAVDSADCAFPGDSAGIVLVGGPGQGKSTITQSLCAVHHAALLAPHAQTLDLAAREALALIEAAQTRDESASPALPRPATVRFPLRIVLPDAAGWLLEPRAPRASGTPAFLAFVAERAARSTVPVATLAALLPHIEWVVIFDGLDEVPAAEARAALLTEARRLIDHLRGSGATGRIVATTRPQGYAGELDGWGELRTWYLVPLSTEQAQQYARQLTDARFEPKRGERILARLAEAAQTATVARLLGSPLQVTILVALIARIGRAPGERWSLFSEYYRIIYEREMERPMAAAEILGKYRTFVDRIHAHVGLLLQTETEQAAGTDATMTTARLRDVMHAVFADQGLDASRRGPIVDELLRAITERLVLLVERRPGHVGFEIRPLQELMAAWALAQKEAQSEARLLRVARSDAFREVVLFLASKAFAELSDVREALVDRVLPAMNEDPEEAIAAAVLRGSVMAVDVLEDGAALSQPKYVERLARLAVRLLELPPSRHLDRLAKVCLADADGAVTAVPVLLRAIGERMDAEGPSEGRLSAWCLLLALVERGDEAARALADAQWGKVEVSLGALKDALRDFAQFPSPWLAQVVSRDLQRFHPLDVTNLIRWSHTIIGAVDAAYGCLKDFRVGIRGGDDRPVAWLDWYSIRQSHPLLGTLAGLEPRSPGWRVIIASARFLLELDEEALAAGLELIAEGGSDEIAGFSLFQLPWPLAAYLAAARTPEQLRALAITVRTSSLGDSNLWRDSECYAEEGSLTLAEVASSPSIGWPLVGALTPHCLPLGAAGIHYVRRRSRVDVVPDELLAFVRRAQVPTLPRFAAVAMAELAVGLLAWAVTEEQDVPLDADDLRFLWSHCPDLPLSALAPLTPQMDQSSEWTDLLDEIGRSYNGRTTAAQLGDLPQLIARIFEQSQRSGLLQFLMHCAVAGQAPAVPPALLKLERYEDPCDQNAVLLLRAALAIMSEPEAEAAGPTLAGASNMNYSPASLLCTIAIDRVTDTTLQRALFRGLLRSLPPELWQDRAALVDAARDLLGSTPSALGQQDIWDALQLPLPRPEQRGASDSSPVSPLERRVVRIDEMRFRNLRGIEELRIVPAPPENGHGQWVVLLGRNGLGKTTVLRGLALALFDIDEPVRRPLPPTAYGAAWRRIAAAPDDPAFVRVTLSGDEHGAEVRQRSDLMSGEQLAPLARPPKEMIFAYGAHRRYLVSDARRTVAADLYALVPSLFEEGADLLPMEASLIPLEAAWHQEPEGADGRLHVELRAALTKLLRVDEITLRGQTLWVRGASTGLVPLKELSDGYLTLAAWVVDLAVRYHRQAEQWQLDRSGPMLASMTGLVLMDEIDLFLHPEWQRSVVRTLKELFPRMSFVVTTHSPLAILGARAEEIWILRRREGGGVFAEQRTEEPFRLTGSDLYDVYFGIESTLPDEQGQKLYRYRQLAVDPLRDKEEDAEAHRLLAELRAADLDPGWEPVPLEQVPPMPESLR